ncbi:unnamed protein product [Prunus brigantina]
MNQTNNNSNTNDSYKLTTTVSVEVSRSVFLPGILASVDSDFTVSNRTSPLGAKAGWRSQALGSHFPSSQSKPAATQEITPSYQSGELLLPYSSR